MMRYLGGESKLLLQLSIEMDDNHILNDIKSKISIEKESGKTHETTHLKTVSLEGAFVPWRCLFQLPFFPFLRYQETPKINSGAR